MPKKYNPYNKTFFSWFKDRSYLHFDKPLTKPVLRREKDVYQLQKGVLKKNKSILKKIFNSYIDADISTNQNNYSKKVAKHQFLPFIQCQTKVRKTYSLPENKFVICHKDKIRYITYASHLDSFIYSYYADLLNKKYEEFLKNKKLSENVLAFRKVKIAGSTGGKSNINFAKEAFDVIKSFKNCSCLCFDIKGFFDNLNHTLLKQAWQKLLGGEKLPDDHYAIFKNITRYSYVKLDDALSNLNISKTMFRKKKRKVEGKYTDSRLLSLCSNMAEFREKIVKNNAIRVNYHKGIPQGSPISGIVSNLYMIDFDLACKNFLNEKKAKYFRYCDDILIIAPEDNLELVENIANFVKEKIWELKLEIQDSKTEKLIFNTCADGTLKIQSVDNSGKGYLQYLGFIFDGQKTLIRPSSISRYYKKLRKSRRLAEKSQLKNKSTILFRKKLYERYSHLGKENFISYTYRASEIMDETRIKKQVRRHFKYISNKTDIEKINIMKTND